MVGVCFESPPYSVTAYLSAAALSNQLLLQISVPFYSSSRNTRAFSREIRAQGDTRLHREYNLAMKNKCLRRIADVRIGKRLRDAHVAARTPRRS